MVGDGVAIELERPGGVYRKRRDRQQHGCRHNEDGRQRRRVAASRRSNVLIQSTPPVPWLTWTAQLNAVRVFTDGAVSPDMRTCCCSWQPVFQLPSLAVQASKDDQTLGDARGLRW